ncbi:MAG TPA: O-antigen ligase domain-containing protein, partial [Acidocella sp.]|nr:O-antigen ligase domain-containing protein [Acidocella sp.]
MVPALVAISALCFLGLTFCFPEATAIIWVLTLETSPDAWLAQQIGGHETIIALVKASGIGLAAMLAIRQGLRWDRFNPAF